MDKDNGSGNVEGAGINTAHRLELIFTTSPWALHINAEVENFDQALAMLDQARRWFEQKIRVAGAMQAQAEMQRAAEDARISAAVRTNRH